MAEEHAIKSNNERRISGFKRGNLPWWWPMIISSVGMGIAVFEAFNNYDNWPVTGLAGSMIMGGVPAALIDAWLRGRSS